MKLWLVRHAPPQVAAGTCYGSSDLAAHAAGTLAAARALSAALPQGIALATSPLQRCEQLSQSLCGLRPDLLAKTDARLAEMDFGAWEGRPWDAIGAEALAAWTDSFWTHRPGGGEPVRALMARVGTAFDEAVLANRDCAWITHAGVVRAARLLAAGRRGVLQDSDWPAEAPGFGAWQVLEL